MKNLDYLEPYRINVLGPGDSYNGAFKVFVNDRSFHVIATKYDGWDHVSVSPKNQKRCPTWEEMCAIKDMFFEAEEEAFQFHPAKSHYINAHPYCLHLWRPHNNQVVSPPAGSL